MPLDTEPDDDTDDRPSKPVNKKRTKRRLGPPMDERELVAILNAEQVDATSYYTSELAKAQGDAMDRYMGKLYGDEVVGRSTVITHDIEDTINWLMPDLMRIFWQTDSLVSVSSANPVDDDMRDTIGDCLSHVFFNDNRGREILHDFAFDGLLQRIGVASVRWEDPEPEPEQTIEGASLDQVLQYQADPEYEIISCDPSSDGEGYDLELQRTPLHGRVRIEVVAPEEFAFSRRSKSLELSGYHRREQELYLADVISMFPDSAGALDPDGVGLSTVAAEIEINADPRALARFQEEAMTTNRESGNHSKRQKIILFTEYVRVDFDNDGIVELRQIKRVGDTVLENIRVDHTEFVTWSPIRVSHKLVGRSLADTMLDIQKIRTVVSRRMMDSLDQSLLNRYGYDKGKMDPEDIDSLIDAEIGGLVGTNGQPSDVLMPLTTPDLTASGYQMLEYTDQRLEQATGVTRHSQGLNPDAANKTATGIDLLQTAANDRIEMIARWLGNGVEGMLQAALRLLCSYQDSARWIKIKGKSIEMDPRTWSDQMSVSVHVAMAASNRQTMLSNLSGIAAKQEQAIAAAGPQNPICGVDKLLHTYTKMTETMGFKDASQFWNTPEQAQALLQRQAQRPPQPDPKMAEVQQKGQLAQQSAQQDAQLAQAKAQAEVQMNQQKLTNDSQLAQQRAAADVQIAAQKVEAEKQIAAEKLALERQIAAERLALEERIAQARIASEMQLARFQAEQNAALNARKAEQDHEHRMAIVKSRASIGTGAGGENPAAIPRMDMPAGDL